VVLRAFSAGAERWVRDTVGRLALYSFASVLPSHRELASTLGVAQRVARVGGHVAQIDEPSLADEAIEGTI
jgi:hypothetical protein